VELATASRGRDLRPPLTSHMRGMTSPELYVFMLAVALCGYLFFNRPFAYLGVPGTPIFLGEILLGAGLALVFRRRSMVLPTLLRSPPLEALLLLLALGTARLLLDLPEYGLLAVRDAALLYYSLFALVVAVVLRTNPPFLDLLMTWYVRILPWFLGWAGVAVVINRRFSWYGPTMPGTDVAVLGFKPGDLGVHAAIGLSFVWLCCKAPTVRAQRLRLLATAAALGSVLIAGTTNRGAIVSAALILGGTALAAPRHRSFAGTTLGVLLLLVALVAVTDARIDVDGREVSLPQFVENVGTLMGGEGSTEGMQQGTVRWRLSYWGEIGQDTLAGRNGPLGLGFGPNLADHYGYQVSFDTEQRLRNAHNSHMTLLARLGLPGLALWLLFWSVWGKSMFDGRRRAAPGTRQWRLAAWLSLSVLGMLVNAVFDPTLEGPQTALWLWTLVGIGCALPWMRQPEDPSTGLTAESGPSQRSRIRP
jgi:hypothetical protein